MSTIWYAGRAGSVVSIEDCWPWYEKVQKLLRDNGLGHVDYRFAGDMHSYSDLDAIADSGFDLIVVDGSHRDDCASVAIRLVRRGGAIYLDNSDRSAAPNQPAMVIAEKTLRDFASRVGAEVIEITDFAPTQLFVNQGILLKVPA
jgi:predicted O-methyltransferase YrrM